MSIYHKGDLTTECLTIQTDRIKLTFPKFPKEMILVLKDRFAANNFTDQRMIDSVNNVIDTYVGWDKLPNIANFIQFDKKIKIFTYNEACVFGMSSLKSIDIGLDKPRWALEEDVVKYKIKLWENKKIVTPVKPRTVAEENKTANIYSIAKEIKNNIGPPKPVERGKYTKKEQEGRLKQFNKSNWIK